MHVEDVNVVCAKLLEASFDGQLHCLDTISGEIHLDGELVPSSGSLEVCGILGGESIVRELSNYKNEVLAFVAIMS